ncbi:MAG TPA: MBL fold metallo-hydrolase [Bacteroidales bacterium]|nr:MBL fold metallo-hydrolase [Bacteroidales bacterium]
MKLYPIHITNFKIDGGAMFGVVPKILWQKKYPADKDNLCNWALRSLLIDTGERVILIDNGYGDKQDEKFFSHVYLNGGDGLEGALKKHGYSFDDVTDMVLTHLHTDHCGGGVKYNSDRSGFEMVFKNATYWVSKQQCEWAVNPNKQEASAFLKENIFPMQESGQLKFIDKNTELYPGIELRLYNGHTVGQIIPFIHTGQKTYVFMADLIPSTAHIPLPWNMAYDVYPMDMLNEKEAFLNEAVKNDYILFFQHDLYNECVTVYQTGKGVRVKETFKL